MTSKTREQWLVAAVNKLKPLFKAIGEDVPEVRVSVGFPGGGSARKRIGECWHPDCSSDGLSQIFISPILDEPGAVLATLVHELVHAIDRGESGHKGRFARIAKAIGLQGKMTATYAGDELAASLMPIAERLGEYPHAKLTLRDNEKKQTTRMVKIECPACGYVLRTTRKWIEQGLPTCACTSEMEVA